MDPGLIKTTQDANFEKLTDSASEPHLTQPTHAVLSFTCWRVVLGWCSVPWNLHAGLVAPRG